MFVMPSVVNEVEITEKEYEVAVSRPDAERSRQTFKRQFKVGGSMVTSKLERWDVPSLDAGFIKYTIPKTGA
jgi:hypothetical protein